jgi:hypothetical protein
MDVDVTQTAAAVMPYVTAAVGAYGASVLDKIRDGVVDKAADETVGLGQGLLGRIFHRAASADAIEGAVRDAAAGEEGSGAALELQIRKTLRADPELSREIAAMLPTGSVHIEASGTRALAINVNSGIANTGDNSTMQQ